MDLLPEVYTHWYFTAARVIHKEGEDDWLWVNANPAWQFDTEDEAQSTANLSNENGKASGFDVVNYPYFVVKVIDTRQVERVQ